MEKAAKKPWKTFATPNGKTRTLWKWRDMNRKMAIAAITYYGGYVSNDRLAEVLGVSPRGLRPHLEIYPEILVRVHGGRDENGKYWGRFQPWYSLNPNALPEKEEVPPMKPGQITYQEREDAETARREALELLEFKECDE